MIYREDIVEFLVAQLGEFYRRSEVYEKNGLLYGVSRQNFETEIEYFCEYNTNFSRIGTGIVNDIIFPGGELIDCDQIEKEIEKRFNVKFAKDCDIICKCGEETFAASYGNYEIFLRCTHCGFYPHYF